MKNILLLIHDDSGQEARLQAALDITRAIEGHLDCLDVAVLPQMTGEYVVGEAEVMLVYDERAREHSNRTRLESRLAHEDVPWSWTDTLDIPAEAIIRAASLADLIVVSIGLARDEPEYLRRLAGVVARKAARPVLAVPPQTGRLDVCGTALIAWDGSSEANEALREAVPLLKFSNNVILLDVDENEGAFAAHSAATYLSRHGVHAKVELAHRKTGGTIHGTILESAHAVRASYIVMGAFGHSMALEAVFGGVTRSMLDHSNLPLLIAHRASARRSAVFGLRTEREVGAPDDAAGHAGQKNDRDAGVSSDPHASLPGAGEVWHLLQSALPRWNIAPKR